MLPLSHRRPADRGAAIAAVVVAACLATAACLVAGPSEPAGAATVEVEVLDHTFEAPTVTVQVGDTVTWVQTSALPHTVTADDGSFDSSPACLPECMGPGDTFSHTFTAPGTYGYHCILHGSPGVGMAGVVIVEAAGPPPTSPPIGPTTTGPPTSGPPTTGPRATDPPGAGEGAGAGAGGGSGATPTTTAPATPVGSSSLLYTG